MLHCLTAGGRHSQDKISEGGSAAGPGHQGFIFHNENTAQRSHRGLTSTTTERLPAVIDLHVSKTAAAVCGPTATHPQWKLGKQHDGRGYTVHEYATYHSSRIGWVRLVP
jgi:hypothetical protein